MDNIEMPIVEFPMPFGIWQAKQAPARYKAISAARSRYDSIAIFFSRVRAKCGSARKVSERADATRNNDAYRLFFRAWLAASRKKWYFH